MENNIDSTPPAPARAFKRRYIVIGVLVLVALAALIYWLISRGKVTTDDAQIEGDLVPISARVSGYVARIEVDDNEYVQPGQMLVELDRRDLNAALSHAEADLANQRAQAAAANQQVAIVKRTAPSQAGQAGAGVSIAASQISQAQKQIGVAAAQARAADAGVDTARSAVGGAESQQKAAAAQVRASQAALKQAQSQVTAAQAEAKKAASDYARYQELFKAGATSQQQLDVVEAANTTAQSALAAAGDRVESARAAVAQAQANEAAASSGITEAKSRLVAAVQAAAQAQQGVAVARTGLAQAMGRSKQAEAAQSGTQTVGQQIAASQAQAQAALAKEQQSIASANTARLQLSYTYVQAPVEGVVSQKSVQLGQYVQPGQLLMALVPLRNVWVVANFKETQIGKMHAGQRATVTVDAYPGRTFEGRIQSIGAATGAQFSLLPPENATGNFVKVVQRIPVKIVLKRPLPNGVVLRPGQNVLATVYLGSGRG